LPQNQRRLGLRPRPHWRSLQLSPDPQLLLRGPTSKGGSGKREGKGKREEEGKGKGGEGSKGVGRVVLKPSQSQISGYVTGYMYTKYIAIVLMSR